MTDNEARDREEIWSIKGRRLKDLNSEADDLACAICELDGGPATMQGTPERLANFKFVWALPKYDRAARRRALTDPL
jgi:hypothetical protein